jgi:hypothetical protein
MAVPVITGFSRLEPRFCVRIVCADPIDDEFMIAIYPDKVTSSRSRPIETIATRARTHTVA